MFIGLSKTIARFSGFRLSVGMRITKKNALWMSLIVMFACMFKAAWYMLLLCGWIMYAIFYGIIWCVKKTIKTFTFKSHYPVANITENYTNKAENDE